MEEVCLNPDDMAKLALGLCVVIAALLATVIIMIKLYIGLRRKYYVLNLEDLYLLQYFSYMANEPHRGMKERDWMKYPDVKIAFLRLFEKSGLRFGYGKIRERRIASLEKLVSAGMLKECGGRYGITDKGVNWCNSHALLLANPFIEGYIKALNIQ